MKPKSREPGTKQKTEPGLDEIITISKDGGRARLELRRPGTPALHKPDSPAGARAAGAGPEANAGSHVAGVGQQKGRAKTQKKSESTAAARKIEVCSPAEAAEPEKPTEVEIKSGLSQDKLALAEAALFLSPRPLMLDELAKIMGVSSLGYVKEALENLKSLHRDGGVEVVDSSLGWEMQVRPQYLSQVAHLAPYADLSEGPKRALALILLKEPMKQSDLIKMQGNKVYDYLRSLERLGMIRREPSGRTKLLTLTKEFERYFGEEKAKVRERIGQEISARLASEAPAEQPAGREESRQPAGKEAAKRFNAVLNEG